MDGNRILSDDNLEQLDLIKNIDIYSIVDKEIDKKRERIKIWSIATSFFIVLLFATIVGIATIVFKTKILLSIISAYYVFSTWGILLLMIPILKRKKVY